MTRTKLVFGVSFALALVVAMPFALADGADDGNRGLQALNQGDYDTAITLFTHAIKYGRLSDDDEEFALANRGLAYLKKGDYSSAIVDLDQARQMKPDDADAQNALLTALQAMIPPNSIPDRPKPNFFELLGKAVLHGIAQGIANGAQPQQ
jgi:tetratricopeptide (TPR) repeat protein